MPIHQPTSALLLIDLQPDFMPGGALAVAGGNEILPLINVLAHRFDHVLLTQDWHPPQHISFATTHQDHQPYQQIQASYGPQTLWPDHCVQHTAGAALHPSLDIPHAELILRKGFRQHIDSYSAFLENDHVTPTGLAGYLRERGLTTLYLAGLAYDFCVRFSALDGKSFGFETVVLEDVCRPVDLPGSVQETNAAFAAAQVLCIQSNAL
jgi:nicotinamidase/pyrazinamidase